MVNICRICAQYHNDSDGFNLFDNTIKSKKTLNRLKKIVGIELKNLRHMPDSICNKCQLLLEQAFQLRLQCRRVQTYLLAKNKHHHSIKKEASTCAINYSSFGDSCSEYQLENEQKVVIDEINFETENRIHDISSLSNELSLDNEWRLIISPVKKTVNCSPNNADDDEQKDFQNTVKIPKAKKTRKRNQKSDNDEGTQQCLDKTLLKTLGRRKKLKIVENSKNDEKSAKFICELCGQSYSAQHYLVSHMNLHKGINPYACELCPQKFHSERNRKRHMMKHAGMKPYPCRYCERRFLDYYARMRHERVHTNERPSKCNYCDKAFTTNYILKNHLLTHTGERPFSCKICERTFSQKKHLAMHLKSTIHKQNEKKSKLNVAVDI